MRFSRILAVVALAAATVITGACGGSEDKAAKPAEAEKVTYVTSFGTFGREAYVYVAQEKGFFKEAGFDVTVKAGTGTGDNLKLIAGGQADYSPVDFTGTLIQLGGNKVQGVTIVTGIHQRTLAGLMTLDGRGITSPKDLEGKNIGDPTGSTNSLMFPTYATLAGIDASKVKFVNVPAQQLPATLASGSVDVIGQFVVGKPTIEKAAGGKKAVLLPYSDYLTDVYGNVLVTSSKIAKEKPDSVRRFSAALLKGLQYSIDHPQEAGQILNKLQPTMDPGVATAEMELMASYVRSTGSGVPVGALDSQRVARSIAILQGAGAIPAGLTPEQVVSFELTPKA